MSLDLGRLDRVLEVDPVSRAARIQAGATGPRIEEQLAEHGMTLRFFPQSFERSTLGGWIATRAAGHFATGPTHIDDLVESVRAVTRARRDLGVAPAARVRRRARRRTACCSAPEGTLAVITEAWVRIRPRDEPRWSARVELDDFAVGLELVREIVQCGHAAVELPAGRGARGAADAERRADDAAPRLRGRRIEPVEHARALCERHGDVIEGGGGAWRDAFLRAPYLRDTLVSMGVLTETFETAVTWDRLPGLIEAVKAAVPCTCRITHAYPDGAAPYFTVVAPARRGEEEAQWAEIKARRGRRGAGRRRHDHPPPRRRARPPALVRPPAPGAVRHRPARRQGGARSRFPPQPRGTLGLVPNVDASAKNMQAVCKAKEVHDRAARGAARPTGCTSSWFDLERIGWEEGDVICGLIVVGDEKVATGMMRVTCDAEPDERARGGRGGGRGGRQRARAGDRHAL